MKKGQASENLSEGRTRLPEEYLAGRNRYPETEPRYKQELSMTMKEQTYRDDTYDRDRTRTKDRDRERDRDKDKKRKGDKAQYRDKSQDKMNRDPSRDRLWQKEVDMGHNGYRHRSRDGDVDSEMDRRGRKEQVRDGERHWSGERSKGRELDASSPSKRWSEENEENSNRQKPFSSNDVFEDPSFRRYSKGQSSVYRGMHRGPWVSLCCIFFSGPLLG